MNRQTIVLQTGDISRLQHVLRVHDLDVECGGPRRVDGGIAITAFVTPTQLRVLHDVEDVRITEIDIPRAREGVNVGRGDRFEGGLLHPSGYGRKLRDEDTET
jgi:hypothetical protein